MIEDDEKSDSPPSPIAVRVANSFSSALREARSKATTNGRARSIMMGAVAHVSPQSVRASHRTPDYPLEFDDEIETDRLEPLRHAPNRKALTDKERQDRKRKRKSRKQAQRRNR